MRFNNRGDSKIGCTIYIIIFLVLCYVGFEWGQAQWNYESMKQDTTELIKILACDMKPTPAKYIDHLMIKAEKANVDLYEEDITIQTKGGFVSIELFWEVPIELPGYTYYLEYGLVRRVKKAY